MLGEELRCRQRLLRRLGYLEGEEGLISVKGRLAADLTTGDELVLAELVFGGTFASLDLEQLAALCSCFVGAERTDKGAKWVTGGRRGCVLGGWVVWHPQSTALRTMSGIQDPGVTWWLHPTPYMR